MVTDDASTRRLRAPESQLRRWCPEAGTHQNEDDPICGWSDHHHRLRIRRMLVCVICDQGYFAREDYDCHECYSAY
jgi:hypothetical protein